MRPAKYRMRSVKVVLPASMCAAMPMLRVWLRSVLVAVVMMIVVSSRTLGHPAGSPTVVSVGAVRLRHPFDVLLLLDGATATGGGVEQLAGDALDSRALGPRVAGGNQPAQAQ